MVTMDVKTAEAETTARFRNHVPFNKVLGLRVHSVDPRRAAAALRHAAGADRQRAPQILHGGVISAVLDVAAGFAILLAVLRKNFEEPRK